MTRQTATQTQQTPTISPLSRGGILQRQCAFCGQHTLTNECKTCQKKELLQRHITNQTEFANLTAIKSEEFSSASHSSNTEAQPISESRFENDFSRIRVQTNATAMQPLARLYVSQPDDRYEHEADQVAELVMQAEVPSLSTASQKSVQRAEAVEASSHGEAVDLPVSLVHQVEHPSDGSPLPQSVRSFLEPRFDADFSSVRIHTGAESEILSRRLHAQAFTYGQHIWLAPGEQPTNLPLLAHELTHVLQQNPLLSRQSEASSLEEPPEGLVQRSTNRYYALPRQRGRRARSPGDRTHEYAVEILGRATPGLYTEVRIPGANAVETSDERTGRADLYKASTTIGVYFPGAGTDATPRFLSSHRDLKLNGRPLQRGEHVANAAPAGKDGSTACRNASLLSGAGICRLDQAPGEIKLGDLKPASLAEQLLGGSQLNNYIQGINRTATRVNQFATNNPDRIQPSNGSWNPQPQLMSNNDISIPAEYANPSLRSRSVEVSLYENEVETRIRKRAVLYLRPVGGGIWEYEFIPTDSFGSTGGGTLAGSPGAQRLERSINSLRRPVKERLTQQPHIVPRKRSRLTASLLPMKRRVQRRATDNFNLAEWRQQVYTPWRREAEQFLGGSGRRAVEQPSPDATEIIEAAALEQIRQRTGLPLRVPSDARSLGRELDQIRHWVDHGLVYGRLRSLFGQTFIKVVGFYERVRDRLRRVMSGRRGLRASGSVSGLNGTIIRSAITVIKSFAGIILNQVGDRLIQAFQTGAQQFINRLLSDEITDFEQHLQQIQQRIQDFEETIRRNFESWLERIIRPFQETIEQVRSVIEGLSEISTWVNRIKWAWRVASCAAPPALGCLWGLVGTTLAEEAAAAIAGSCWFRREVMFPILRELPVVQSLPNQIANFILDQIRELLPESLRELLGSVDTSAADINADDIECENNDVRVSPQHEQIMALFEEFGEEKMDALLRAMEHRGVRGNVPLTPDQIDSLRSFLQRHSADEIESIFSEPRQAPSIDSVQDAISGIEAQISTPPDPNSSSTTPSSEQPEETSGSSPAAQPNSSTTPQASSPDLSTEELRRRGEQVSRRIRQLYRRVPPGQFRIFFSGQLELNQDINVFLIDRLPDGSMIGGSVVVTPTQQLPGGSWLVRFNPGGLLFAPDGTFSGRIEFPVMKVIETPSRSRRRR